MRPRLIAAAVALIALVAFFAVTAGPPAPPTNRPHTISFAVLGDAPYFGHEELQYRVVMKDIARHDLVSVIHVGDAFWRPCSDAMYAKTRARLDALPHPVVYTPGDNEWFDCWEPRVGGYVPGERLAQLRKTFFSNPGRSLGAQPIALASQKDFPENARWRHGSIVFATVHVIGSKNGLLDFPGRTAADDEEVRRREAAVLAWLRETFAEARATDATAVVIAFHTNVFQTFDAPDWRAAFAPFIAALEDEARRFGKPVLAAQGGSHVYIVDRPLPAAPNLTRLQVPGSPIVGWVRVSVNPAQGNWTFENRVIPRWKYW